MFKFSYLGLKFKCGGDRGVSFYIQDRGLIVFAHTRSGNCWEFGTATYDKDGVRTKSFFSQRTESSDIDESFTGAGK